MHYLVIGNNSRQCGMVNCLILAAGNAPYAELNFQRGRSMTIKTTDLQMKMRIQWRNYQAVSSS
jgi:hypothetical protein